MSLRANYGPEANTNKVRQRAKKETKMAWTKLPHQIVPETSSIGTLFNRLVI